MKTGVFTFLKFLGAAYFLLSSAYCLLAYLPYTYTDVIKAPPYAWMPWFAHWHALLYWVALLSLLVVNWKRSIHSWFGGIAVALISLGVFITVRPFLPSAQDNNTTFLWSLAMLLAVSAIAAQDIPENLFWHKTEQVSGDLFEYSTAVKAGVAIALLYALSAIFHRYTVAHSFALFRPAYDSELIVWSLVSHTTLLLLLLSIFNLVRMATARVKSPRTYRLLFLHFGIAFILWWSLDGFLGSALSFDGWQAHVYAALFAATLTLCGFSLGSPLLKLPKAILIPKKAKLLLAGICIATSGVAFAFPYIVGGADWNGMFQSAFTIVFWVVLAITFYVFRPARKAYSFAAVLGVLIFTGFGYKALQASEILWAKPLGGTDDSISKTFDLYASQDSSFDLVHHFLYGKHVEECGDLCHIMRQYANIRKPIVKQDVDLVSHFVPTRTERPNIFIFVIDSLRPDYLGAYNPKVNFTPNLDKFAKDSVVIQNVFTQYTGTSLSEPAIWSGTLLLHSHYQQPFHKLNNLEKLAEGDGYQMIVSWDVILRQILSPPSDLIKLDTDKPLWNNFEACSTIQQLEDTMDRRTDRARPVFFYAQPDDVHQFAKNDLPKRTSANWQSRPGFNDRIAYALNHVDSCLGGFFDYLRAQKLYDNSIIIVTADHGDATGELGRISHSVIMYPEVMRVPLIFHLPVSMKKEVVYDNTRISTLTDITPSLYSLLGHRPVANPMFGRPLFAETEEELHSYKRDDVFFSSDATVIFGLLEDHGRFFYATYDSPPKSYLYDLAKDPLGTKNIVTPDMKQLYDRKIIEHLHAIGDFYGYKPGIGSLLTSSR